MRQSPDLDLDCSAHDLFSTVLAMRATNPAATCSLVMTGQDLTLGSCSIASQEMNPVAVATHDAGCRRDVIGDDPVAALARELCLGVFDQIFRFGGKADHQRRALRPPTSKSSTGYRGFRRAAAAARPSTFFSVSARLHWRRASRRRRRRKSRCRPAARLLPGATCRARIPHASRLRQGDRRGRPAPRPG